MAYIEPKDVYTNEDLAALIDSDGVIQTSITIRGEYLREIIGVEKIVGSLGSGDSKLESFGSLKEVGGDIWFSIHTVAPLIEDLGTLESVGGNLSLKDLKIKSLGNLKRVGGNLNLRNTPIEDLGVLEFVGGSLSLPKNLQGNIDLSQIQIDGRVSYHKEYDNRLDNIPQNQSTLAESEIPVPLWKKVYAFSVAVLDLADAQQKEFYDYFKQNFLNGKILDVRGNNNYVFALMFDLIEDFRAHRNEQLVIEQLTMLENAYPVIQKYTEENLAAAIKGKPGRSDHSINIEINLDLDEMFNELQLNNPELFETSADDDDNLESEDNEDLDYVDDEFDDEDEFEDEDDNVEKYNFPPDNPIYAVSLTEKRDENYECLETSVAINENPVAELKARVNSVRADISADRLFVQTLHSENEDSFSIFCFELSTGKRLWQTHDIPPSGSLYIDKGRKRLEAGLSYGYAENYLVLLDYNGRVLERNYGSGYEMVEAAEEYFKDEQFEKAKELFLQALETSISINTKIKAAKKLARIGKLTHDNVLFSHFTARATELESEKTAEKAQQAARSARQVLSLAERLSERDDKYEEIEEDTDESYERSVYWNKRFKQIEEDGGS